MTTVDKSSKTFGRTNQLQPSEILERLRQGDEYNAAGSPAAKKIIAKKYDWSHQDSFSRAKIAAMFGAASRFNPHYVSRTPWRILDVISQESKPADLRNMLADLIFYAVKLASMGTEPSAASIAPDVALVEKIMSDPEMYRREIEILHAHMQDETSSAYDTTVPDFDLLEEPLPDLRAIVFGLKRQEEAAIEEANEILARAPIVTTDHFIPAKMPEQQAFPSQPGLQEQMQAMLNTLLEQSVQSKIAALTEEINAMKRAMAADEERKASWHRQLINMLQDVSSIAESAGLLKETVSTASDTIVAMIEELKR